MGENSLREVLKREFKQYGFSDEQIRLAEGIVKSHLELLHWAKKGKIISEAEANAVSNYVKASIVHSLDLARAVSEV